MNGLAYRRPAQRQSPRAAFLAKAAAPRKPRLTGRAVTPPVKRNKLKKLRWHEINDQQMIDLLDGPPNWSGTDENFRPYQWYIYDRIMTQPAVLVGAKMGLGKTGASLRAAKQLLDEGVVKKILIVAPLRVAEETWPEELRVWDFARTLTYSVLCGDDEDRKIAAAQDTEIHVINRENLVWLYKHFGVRRWPYDMLIYDEASRLKGASKRTAKTKRADGTVTGRRMSGFGVLSRVRFKFKRVVELSGTPASNGLIDLWGPMYILDKGERLGDSFTAYKQRWFNEDRERHSIEPFDHSEPEIMEAIDDLFFSLSDEDYLDLPPLIPNDRWVTLDSKVMKDYRKFEKEFYLEEHDIEAVSKGVLLNKLLQLANGSVYNDEKTAIAIHDRKLVELESVIEEACGEPVLIAYEFKFDIDRIKKRFPKFRIYGDSASDMRDWNRGRIPGMIVHPASAGHGLNFQYGGHIACWYGLTWSLELYQQFNKRLHRSGQKGDHVMLHHILARGTVDEMQFKALTVKGATQDRITDRVRIRQSDILASERYRMAA